MPLRGVTDSGCALKVKPVVTDTIRRTNRERHRIARDTRAGLECQLRISVPTVRKTLRVVRIRNGGNVKQIQIGVTNKIRINKVVRAGLVVADVAVRWVDKKSVNCMNGSSNMLHLEVNTVSVSTISSRLF